MAIKKWITKDNFVICNHEVIAECISADMALHIAACHNEDQQHCYSKHKNDQISDPDMFWSNTLKKKVTIPGN